MTTLALTLGVLCPTEPAGARVAPPETSIIEALDAARPSFERCALDSRLPETAFHTLALRVDTENRRVSAVQWGQPFIGPTADQLLRCMSTIVRVALRPRRLHVGASQRVRYVPLPDLDYPMQPPPAAAVRVMSASEVEAFVQQLRAAGPEEARLALLIAQEETHVAVPVASVASVLEAFGAPNLAVGGALCRVVSGPRALARVTRGLPMSDARRLRALTRGRCGVPAP